MSSSSRIFGLDLLRVIAIACVVHAHSAHFVANVRTNDIALYYFGYVGVELFFVLSGFLIGTILLKTFGEETDLRLRQVGHFWLRRWLRTLPNYYLAFLVVAACVGYLRSQNILNFPDYQRLWWFGANLWTKPTALFSVAWSLAVEEWFYLIFPLLVLPGVLLWRRGGKTIVGITALLLVILGLWARYWAFRHGGMNWHDHFRKLVPLRIDGIAMGVLAAWCKMTFSEGWKRWRVLWLGIGMAVMWISWSYFLSNYLFRRKYAGEFECTVFFTLFSAGIAFLLPAFDCWKQARWRWVGVVVGFLAAISYSLYLYHTTVNMFLDAPKLKGWGAWGTAVGVSILVSAAAYYAVERPIMRWRDRLGRESDRVRV